MAELRFEITWADNFGYRVTVPNLLKDGERKEVVDAASYDRLKEALESIRDNHWVENALDPQWPARVAKKVLEVDDG